MSNVTIGGIIQTSIVTAFTIAAALIWKDVIEGTLKKLFPTGDLLIYQFLVAVLATIIVVIAIYLTLKAEAETEGVMKKWKKRKLKKRR